MKYSFDILGAIFVVDFAIRLMSLLGLISIANRLSPWVCLSGYSEHQIHLHITQFWQIVWFAPKFSTLVIEMDANSQNERDRIAQFWSQNRLVVRKKDYLPKTQILPLQTQARGSAPTLLSAFDLCGNFVAATEVNPPMLPMLTMLHYTSHWSESSTTPARSLIYRLLAGSHKWFVECNIGVTLVTLM